VVREPGLYHRIRELGLVRKNGFVAPLGQSRVLHESHRKGILVCRELTRLPVGSGRAPCRSSGFEGRPRHAWTSTSAGRSASRSSECSGPVSLGNADTQRLIDHGESSVCVFTGPVPKYGFAPVCFGSQLGNAVREAIDDGTRRGDVSEGKRIAKGWIGRVNQSQRPGTRLDDDFEGVRQVGRRDGETAVEERPEFASRAVKT
jgi:hypothetical protein